MNSHKTGEGLTAPLSTTEEVVLQNQLAILELLAGFCSQASEVILHNRLAIQKVLLARDPQGPSAAQLKSEISDTERSLSRQIIADSMRGRE
jgi:hypothetical protein